MLKSFPPSATGADSREYIGALAAALCLHPRSIAVACADVANGVIRECMFKPTSADLHTWCNREATPLFDQLARHEHEAKLVTVAKSDEQIAHERKMRESYDELKAKHGPTWGLGTMPDKLEQLRGNNTDLETEAETVAHRQRTAAAARADRQTLNAYAKLGTEPKHFGGILVSPYLLRTMGHDVAPPSTTNKNDDAEEA